MYRLVHLPLAFSVWQFYCFHNMRQLPDPFLNLFRD